MTTEYLTVVYHDTPPSTRELVKVQYYDLYELPTIMPERLRHNGTWWAVEHLFDSAYQSWVWRRSRRGLPWGLDPRHGLWPWLFWFSDGTFGTVGHDRFNEATAALGVRVTR